ncbi:MAG TPA: two-component regulator propeller domain-containing protein, partial [Lysobacter sp.]
MPVLARSARARAAARLRAHVAALLLCATLGAPAATREIYFEPLGSERGLVQGSVGAITQDALGFVWVGTQGGLHRYDGQRYRVYRHDPNDPASLPDSFVTELAAGDGPALWVGTFSRYVARMDLRTGAIRRYDASAGDHRDDRQVVTMAAAPDALWVGTVGGLDRLDPASGRRTRVLDLPGRSGTRGQQLLRDRDGRIWYATGAGLFRIDGRDVRRVGTDAPAWSLLQDREGRLWVGGDRGLEQLRGDAR